MADIVNLNRARKKKKAADKEKSAAANRVKFGLRKSERAAARAEKERAERALGAHERDADD